MGRRLQVSELALTSTISATIALGLLSGCGPGPTPHPPAVPSVAIAASSTQVNQLKADNERLSREVAHLKQQIEDLNQTPQALLSAVTEKAGQGDLQGAREGLQKLSQRFAGSPQERSGLAAVARAQASQHQREQEALRQEARGIFGVPEHPKGTVGVVTIQKESIKVDGKWISDAYANEWMYQDSERGERFVVMHATLKSSSKSPLLPDVALYKVDGKRLVKVDSMRYQFRRWQSHATFIGLYHDSGNDFAYSAQIPFSIGLAIPQELAREPLALIATGEMCHKRDKRIGSPEVFYSWIGCNPKDELAREDFVDGGPQVIAFLNKPKGL